MQRIKRFLSFLKNKRKITYPIIAVILLLFLVFIFRNGNSEEQTIIARLGDFKNQISVSGKVIASSSVELGFKNSGRVNKIYFSVDELTQTGKIVKAGTLITALDNRNAQQDLRNAEISLANAKLSLTKLQLENSSENLKSDLQKAYDDGFVAVSNAFLDFSDTINGLDDMLGEDSLSENTARISGSTALNYRKNAETLFYKARNTYKENQKIFKNFDRNSSEIEIENIINETYDTTKIMMDTIKSLKILVDYLYNDSDRDIQYIAFQNSLYSYTNTINAHLSILLSEKNDIRNYKDAFSTSDLDEQSSVLSVQQKESALQDAKDKLEDYYIRAPFDGIITKIDIKVGEIVSPDRLVVSMISKDIFQIESYLPEVNIALVNIGDEAKISLDAYGEDVEFLAQVISIDPAETIRDGVSTYKVKLQFIENDVRIKSGMTANVLITAVNKPNVIVLPQGVILEKNGNKFVQIKNNEEIIERQITIGNISSLGQVEIISGVIDGDVIILNPKTEL